MDGDHSAHYYACLEKVSERVFFCAFVVPVKPDVIEMQTFRSALSLSQVKNEMNIATVIFFLSKCQYAECL